MSRGAIALFSGGLDSSLAIRMMQVQGIKVNALHFVSPFFGSSLDAETGKYNARLAAEGLGVTLTSIALGTDYLEMLRAPKHGYGKAINPCVDCHAFFFRIAKGLMADFGASFVISGEVLGQRPMSQRRDTLRVVERESGLDGLLLRPLSARLLPITIPEQEGWVDRNKLGAIQGRSRKEQIRLADELGVIDYPTPAGGCLLTEVSYVAKVRDVFDHVAALAPRDFQMLKVARHLRVGPRTKVLIGRNEAENQTLEGAAEQDETILRWLEGSSPLGLVVGEQRDDAIETAAKILLRYTKASAGQVCSVYALVRGEERRLTVINDFSAERVEQLRI